MTNATPGDQFQQPPYDKTNQRPTPATSGRAGGWDDPEPLPAELPPVEPFDDRLLPESLRPWIADIAERMQVPPDFPAVAAMIVLAGIVGRKVGIRPKRFDDWQVTPNLWGAVIGRPGLMKTHAIMGPLHVLMRLEIEAKAAYDEAGLDYQSDKMVADERKKVGEQEIRAAIKDDKKGDPKAIAARIVAEEAAAPVRRRYRTSDSTVEKLGVILNENPNGVTVYRDELIGFLKLLDRAGQEGARAFFLETWNGDGRFTFDRIGRGTIDIESTTVSIIGGITPGALSEYLRSALQGGAGDDGLIQRFQLAVWPDSPATWRNVDRWPDTNAKRDAFETYLRLDQLNPEDIRAECDDDSEMPFLRFSPDAQGQFDDWRADLERRLRSGDDHAAIESHLAKYRSLIPSLALLIHLADSPTGGPVAAQALDMAIRWGWYLESHARRIYGQDVNAEVAAARALARKIVDGTLQDGFSLRDVYRSSWSQLATRDDAAAAVELLIDLGWLRVETLPTGGRERTRHRINLRILSDPCSGDLTKLTKAASVSSVSSSDGGAVSFAEPVDADAISTRFEEGKSLEEINDELANAAAEDAQSGGS